MKNNISKYTPVQANCRKNHFIEVLNKITGKKRYDTYTRILPTALNVNWKRHTSNDELDENLPKIAETI